MKYTKKMVKVPETEYHALMSLIKRLGGGDNLQTEKAILETRILENLNDPGIDEHLKSLKHAQMLKERKELAKIIENKPQRVIIENQPLIPNLPPYLGLTLPPPPIKTEEELTYTEEPPTEEEEEFKDAEEREKTPIERKGTKPRYESPKFLLTPKKRKELEKIIQNNYNKLPLTMDGTIVGLNGKPVSNSSFMKTLDYYEGKLESSPKGKYFLERQLFGIPEVKKLLNLEQTGSGKKKRVLVKLKPIKTIGLTREPEKIPFKPRIWAKL